METDSSLSEQIFSTSLNAARGTTLNMDTLAQGRFLSYLDVADISEYAIPAFQWACGSGVINGVTDATLVPQGTATRAQVATILMRFCENIAE